jgi:hypothetical protein
MSEQQYERRKKKKSLPVDVLQDKKKAWREKLACSPGSSQQDYGSLDRNSSVIVAQ